MAITQEEILQLTVSMFNASLGANYLADIESANFATTADLAAYYGTLTEFTSQFDGMTDAEQVTAMLSNFGLDSTNTAAFDYFTAQVAAGVSNAVTLQAADAYLATQTAEVLATYSLTDAAATLVNKTAAATYYSVTTAQSAATVADLKATVSTITEDVATVATANAAVDTAVAAAATIVNLETLSDTNTAMTTFLQANTVDTDTPVDGLGNGDAAEVNLVATNATAAVDTIVVGDTTYTAASDAVKAAMLADKVAALNTTLTTTTTAQTTAQANIDAVTGLATAVTTLNAADAAALTAANAKAAATTLTPIELTKATALIDANEDYIGSEASGVVTVTVLDITTAQTGTPDLADAAYALTELNADGGTTGIMTLTDGVTDAGLTAGSDALAEFEAVQALLADYITAYNSVITTTAADTAATATAASAQAVVDYLDLSVAAKADLLEIGAEIETDSGTVVSVATPTAAEISGHTTALNNVVNAAIIAAEGATNTNSGFVMTNVAVDLTLGANAITATENSVDDVDVLTAGTGTELAALIAAVANYEAFATLVDDYATTATADTPLVTALDTADTNVENAQIAVDALATAAAAEVTANAVVVEMGLLQDAIDAAQLTFTDAGQTVPVTLAAGVNKAASAASDVYLVDTVTDGAVAISSFGAIGDDSIYFGDYTLNTGDIATDGDNSVLEYWADEVGGAAVYTFETSTFGSNATTAETIVVTLTGVALADTTVSTDGFIS